MLIDELPNSRQLVAANPRLDASATGSSQYFA